MGFANAILGPREQSLKSRLGSLADTVAWIEGRVTVNRQMHDRLERRVDKLNGTAAGEPRTGRSTTPTCGSTVRGAVPRPHLPDSGKISLSEVRVLREWWDLMVPVVGEPCPCCGKKVRKPAMTNAERQRKYRASK